MEENNSIKYKQAQASVKKLKGFYVHVVVYILVNVFISFAKILHNIYKNGAAFKEAFWDIDTFVVWIFWGIGLAIHGFNVLGFPFLFGKDWENRKIQKIIEKEQQQYHHLKH